MVDQGLTKLDNILEVFANHLNLFVLFCDICIIKDVNDIA